MSMEKNRIRPIATGKNMRMSYSRQEEVLEMPNLIEVQRDSYQWFLDEGLSEAFADISPITDYSGKLSLEFTDLVGLILFFSIDISPLIYFNHCILQKDRTNHSKDESIPYHNSAFSMLS